MAEAETPHPEEARSRRTTTALRLFVAVALAYLVVAYLLLPLLWRHHEKRHPALADAPELTHTASGIPGDPLNVALVGTEEEVHLAETLSGAEEAFRFLKPRLSDLPHEVFACIFMNQKHGVLAYRELFRGSIHASTVHPREVVKAALKENAAAVILWGILGLAGVVYVLIVVRRMRVQTAYSPVFEDQLFHVLLPFAAYATLAGSAVAARWHAGGALFAVGAAALLLLFIGIHNAWDAVTYHVFVRKQEQGEKERG